MKRAIRKRQTVLTKKGFTMVELLLTMSILAILFTVVTTSLSTVISKSNIQSAAEILIADMREQQIKAMAGYELITGGGTDYGVVVFSDKYILFSGDSYIEGMDDNFTVNLQPGLEFDTSSLPFSTVVFERMSGEVASFNDSLHTIIIRNPTTQESRSLVFNSLGVVELL